MLVMVILTRLVVLFVDSRLLRRFRYQVVLAKMFLSFKLRRRFIRRSVVQSRPRVRILNSTKGCVRRFYCVSRHQGNRFVPTFANFSLVVSVVVNGASCTFSFVGS